MFDNIEAFKRYWYTIPCSIPRATPTVATLYGLSLHFRHRPSYQRRPLHLLSTVYTYIRVYWYLVPGICYYCFRGLRKPFYHSNVASKGCEKPLTATIYNHPGNIKKPSNHAGNIKKKNRVRSQWIEKTPLFVIRFVGLCYRRTRKVR